jgi:hypothetical protein
MTIWAVTVDGDVTGDLFTTETEAVNAHDALVLAASTEAQANRYGWTEVYE